MRKHCFYKANIIPQIADLGRVFFIESAPRRNEMRKPLPARSVNFPELFSRYMLHVEHVP